MEQLPAFDIPQTRPNLAEVDRRLQLQNDVLGGLYATAQAAVDERINDQAGVLGGIAAKAIKSVDKRIRSQSKMLEPIVSSALAAVDNALARQGAQLALQSELLPRIRSAADATVSGVESALPSPSIGAFGTPIPGSRSTSSKSPGGSPSGGRAVTNAVLVNCVDRSLGIYNLTDVSVQFQVRTGKYVPIRYGSVDDLQGNFLGDICTKLKAFQASWIATACHAYENNGDGWPVNGDFLAAVQPPGEPALCPGYAGEPVGDWPFPR